MARSIFDSIEIDGNLRKTWIYRLILVAEIIRHLHRILPLRATKMMGTGFQCQLYGVQCHSAARTRPNLGERIEAICEEVANELICSTNTKVHLVSLSRFTTSYLLIAYCQLPAPILPYHHFSLTNPAQAAPLVPAGSCH